MNLRNNVQLIGNLGSDPIVKETANGSKLAKISVATAEYYKEKGSDEFKEKTTWHNVIAWGKLAEIIEKKCVKGTEVVIYGKIDNRTYDDDAGNKRYISEIIVGEIIYRNKVA